ncbi:uncharacterized protein LOC108737043 [Agrilus planipennis]|uniref:Uncharacterized protein LOC108737043 n=1 Tax=Agrilus planipennis TaxID=224129 RepID=A0A7F5RN43_AGRPL|nr:uncharacterized protein LOC108737043 [Agrilus planipennis]
MVAKNVFIVAIVFFGFSDERSVEKLPDNKRNVFDESVHGYLMERTCWWNEVCKEEFQYLFRCRCPSWSFCRAPGRYYNAYCAMSATGYIWSQPEMGSEIRQKKSLVTVDEKKSIDNKTTLT